MRIYLVEGDSEEIAATGLLERGISRGAVAILEQRLQTCEAKLEDWKEAAKGAAERIAELEAELSEARQERDEARSVALRHATRIAELEAHDAQER